jgi:PAS domain S-box-containing protein
VEQIFVKKSSNSKTPVSNQDAVVLSSFLMLNPNPIIETDFDGNVFFSNRATKKFFGSKKIGFNHPLFVDWSNIISDIKEEKTKSFFRDIKVGENWFIQQFFLVPGSEKVRIYFIPINDLKNAQHELEKERNLLKNVMNGSKNVNLVYLDRDFRFVRVNDAYAKTCGYTPQEMIGKNHFDLYPHLENEAIFKQVRDSGIPVEFKDKPFVFLDQPERGVTYWDWTLQPIKNETGHVEGLVFSLVETTEKKIMHHKLEEYASKMEELAFERAKQLHQAERLATIGETAAMVGHDIRNPLQSIAGELYLAKNEVESLPDTQTKKGLQESISIIEENLYYIDKIVADLQDYTRPLKPNYQKVSIKKVVEEALLIVSIPSNLQVSIVIAEDYPSLNGDFAMLKRAFINLIQNAVQAMPDGGLLQISATSKNNQAYISVHDTGGGICEEVKYKLFTPLFTTKSKGQGFGLAVVKRLVEAQNGKVSFESQKGKGTTFTVELRLT